MSGDEQNTIIRTEKYDAFLSYSHRDEELARALQLGLQRLARPWNKRRALRVFRDNSDLASDPGLWSSIRTALGQSRYLIVIVTPDAVGSTWVGKEVDYWLDSHELRTVLLILAGVPQGHEPALLRALPGRLSGAYEEEPRYTKLTGVEPAAWTLKSPVFRRAMADLAAPVHGKDRSDLEAEDLLLFRKARRLQFAAVSLLCLIACMAICAGLWATVNARRAQSALTDANSSRKVADQQVARAKAASADADQATQRAQEQEAKASAASRSAERQRKEAAHQAGLAEEFRASARTARAEARRQLAIAVEQEALAAQASQRAEVEQVRARTATRTAEAQQRLAIAAHGEAVRQNNIAASRRLATQSATLLSVDPVMARKLAVAAYKVSPTVDAEGALISMGNEPFTRMFESDDDFGVHITPASGRRVLVADPLGSYFYDTRTGRSIRGPEFRLSSLLGISLSPDNHLAVAVDSDGATAWDMRTKKPTARIRGEQLEALADGGHGHFQIRTDHDTSLYDRRGELLGRIADDRLFDGAQGGIFIHMMPGGRVLTADEAGTVATWNLVTGRRIRTVGLEKPTQNWTGLVLSPDGRSVAAETDDEVDGHVIRVWDVVTGKLRTHTLQLKHTAGDITFSADGRFLGQASDDGKVQVWRVAAGESEGRTYQSPSGRAIDEFTFSPDGQRLVTVDEDALVRVFTLDLAHDVLAPPAENDSAISALITNHGRRLMVGTEFGTVRVHALPSGALLRTYPGLFPPSLDSPHGPANLVADQARSEVVAGGFGAQVFRPGVSASRWHYLTGKNRRAYPVALSPDGSLAALAGPRQEDVSFYNPRTRKYLGGVSTHRDLFLDDIEFNHAGTEVALADSSGVTFWDPVTHRPSRPAISAAQFGAHLSFSPDDKLLAISSSRADSRGHGQVTVWDVARRRQVGDLAMLNKSSFSAEFNRSGTLLASLSYEGALEFWDTQTWRRVASLPGDNIGYSVDLDSNTGQAATTYADGSTRIWSVEPHRLIHDICRDFGGDLTRSEWNRYVGDRPYAKICE